MSSDDFEKNPVTKSEVGRLWLGRQCTVIVTARDAFYSRYEIGRNIMKINKTTLRDRSRLAIAGIEKHLANEATLSLDGTARTTADIKQQLAGTVNASDATQAARGQWLDAVKAEQALHATTVALLGELRTLVTMKFGKTAVAILADFGFEPRKQRQPSVETKAGAVQKASATRTARRTMGSRQKQKVTGTTASASSATPPGSGTAKAGATAASGTVVNPETGNGTVTSHGTTPTGA